MRKSLFMILLIFFSIQMYSQKVQEGYVKTRARKNVQAQYISDVIIKAKGVNNKVKSDSVGKFTIVFLNKKEGEGYILESIKKKGYELVDLDIIGQPFPFSTNVPVKILMEPEGVLSAEILESETFVKNMALESRNSAYEHLKNNYLNAEISETAFFYDSILIDNEYNSILNMASTMAKQYVSFDYDSTDSIDVAIYNCIEKGDFVKADQMIFEQTAEYKDCLAMVNRLHNGGAEGGPGLGQSLIRANSSEKWTIKFVKGVESGVVLYGDGDTVLQLFIYGSPNSLDSLDNQALLGYDEGVSCFISFIPKYTGEYEVIIKNNGDVYNQYTIDVLP